jgi:hypothetical protein
VSSIRPAHKGIAIELRIMGAGMEWNGGFPMSFNQIYSEMLSISDRFLERRQFTDGVTRPVYEAEGDRQYRLDGGAAEADAAPTSDATFSPRGSVRKG